MSEKQIRSPLDVREFQDFLLSQALMQRVDGFDPNKVWTIRSSGKDAPTRDRLWLKLLEAPGYLIPRMDITEHLYGFSDPAETHAAYLQGMGIKPYLEDPDSLFVARLGQGLGVKSFDITQEDVLNPVYYLWKDINKFVDVRVLSHRLVGGVQPRDIQTTLSRYNELPDRVNFKNAQIQAADFNNRRHYRIKLPDEENVDPDIEKYGDRSIVKGVYKQEFQDWLVEIGALHHSEGFRIMILKEGRKFSRKESKVLRLLTNYAGYMLPREAIARIYYGETYPNNWQDRLAGNLFWLRQKCTNPEDLYLPIDGGYAVGVRSLEIPVSALPPLRELWDNMDKFVQLGEGSGLPAFNKHAVHDVRKVLNSSDYALGSLHGKPGLLLITNRRNLVEFEDKSA